MDKRLTSTTPGNRPAAADELKCLPQVEQVMRSLTKLIHGRKLYAENNPRLAEFGREFHASLRAFFRHEDSLVLGIEQNAITWRGEVVYENDKRDESIAFFLRRDGVGEITIHGNAVGRETDCLVRILTEEYHNLTSDEDIVTKFWNADFGYISYRVLDDYLSVEYAQARPGESDEPDSGVIDHLEMLPSLEDKGRVIVDRGDPLESIDDYLKKLVMRACPSPEADQREAHFQSMLGAFFSISQEEIKIYQGQLLQESQQDSLPAFMEAVMVFTLLHDNPSAVRDISGVIDRIVDYAAADLDPHTLRRIIALVQDFKEGHQLPENIEAFCNIITEKVSENTVIQALGERLKFWNKDSGEILAYFAAVGPVVIDPLLMVLHNVEGEKLHKEICDVLIEVSGGDITAVVEKLDIDIPEIASDAVYIANRVGMEHITPKMKELLFYPDLGVKEGMIKLVARVDDSSSVDLLLRAMADENTTIRMQALEALATKTDPRVLRTVTEVAFGKQLAEQEPDEQELIFKVMGKVGNAGTVEQLRKFVERKSIVNFGKNRDNKMLAMRALEHIKSPASLKLLKKLAEDSNELVRTRAKRAYSALQRVMKEQRDGRLTVEKVL